jgi:hypothetical protein
MNARETKACIPLILIGLFPGTITLLGLYLHIESRKEESSLLPSTMAVLKISSALTLPPTPDFSE